MEGLIAALKQPLFIAYSILSLIGAILLAIVSEGNKGREWVWVDVGLCAIFGGYTVLATKGLSTLLSLELIGIFKEWITYPLVFVLLGTGILQIRYLNRALMNFDSKIVIPTQFVFFNLAAIVGSAILYRDFEHVDFHTFLTFVYGCATTFLGVFILTLTSGASEGKVADMHGHSATSTSAVGTITTGTPLVLLDDPVVASAVGPVGGAATLSGAATAATVGTAGAARAILNTKGSRASLSISPGQVREHYYYTIPCDR
jgi:magnesium transporter